MNGWPSRKIERRAQMPPQGGRRRTSFTLVSSPPVFRPDFRKNLRTLLRAFSRLKRDRRFGGLKLVKIGKAGGPEADFRGRTLEEVERLGLGRDVVFTGYVP